MVASCSANSWSIVPARMQLGHIHGWYFVAIYFVWANNYYTVSTTWALPCKCNSILTVSSQFQQTGICLNNSKCIPWRPRTDILSSLHETLADVTEIIRRAPSCLGLELIARSFHCVGKQEILKWFQWRVKGFGVVYMKRIQTIGSAWSC